MAAASDENLRAKANSKHLRQQLLEEWSHEAFPPDLPRFPSTGSTAESTGRHSARHLSVDSRTSVGSAEGMEGRDFPRKSASNKRGIERRNSVLSGFGKTKRSSTAKLASFFFEPLLPETETVQEVDDEGLHYSRSTTEARRFWWSSSGREGSNSSRFFSQAVRLRTPSLQRATSICRGTLQGLKACFKHSYRLIRRDKKDLPNLCATYRFRLLDRDGPFGQSNGHWAINNIASKRQKAFCSCGYQFDDHSQNTSCPKCGKEIAETNREVLSAAASVTYYGTRDLFMKDLYHTFVDAKISYQLMFMGLFYLVSFIIFALFFLLISKPCGLGLQGSFIQAYLLSLETMITIGYGTGGTGDPYLNGCWEGALVLTVMSLLQLLMSSILIGVIFQGLSRPQSRACTIICSEKALIREIDGVHYFMFRICDLRIQHSLIEPHVRCYCAYKDPVHGFQMIPMRLEHPDDDLGGALLLTMPTVVVHRIDAWSPLMHTSIKARQPIERHRGHGNYSPLNEVEEETPTQARSESSRSFFDFGDMDASQKRHVEHLRLHTWPGTLQRQIDCETGNRDSSVCPYCGDSFGTAAMLEMHCRYYAHSDRVSDYPPEICHQEMESEALSNLTHSDPSRDEVQKALSVGFREVIVLVEGIEATTSSTLQARHSYCIGNGNHDELVWDKEFEPCGRVPGDVSKGFVLDLQKFHKFRDTRK